MKPELVKELEKYFGVIKERMERIEISEEDGRTYGIEKRYSIDNLHIIAIGILNDKNFNFEKDRIDGDRYKVEGNKLERCRYKCKRWGEVCLFSDFQILNNEKFSEMVREINGYIEENEFKKREDNDSHTYKNGTHSYYNKEKDKKYNISLNMNTHVEYIDGQEVKKDIITRIYINQFTVDIIIESFEHYTSSRDIIYDDDIYAKIVKLVKMHHDAADERRAELRKHKEEIKKIIGKHGFDEYLVLNGI